jgi:SAM-dependent methyltransferase
MCGYGRHAIALARNGIHVTAVDNLEEYVEEIKAISIEEHLPLKAVRENIVKFKADDTFDLVICMGNSLNFFDECDTQSIFSNAASALKQNGHILINSWSLEEIVREKFKERSSSRVLGLEFINDSKYLNNPNRIETESTIITSDGREEKKLAIDYVYSIPEMEAMLNKSGFTLKEVYSIPGKKIFTAGEPRAYIIAERIE